MHYLDSKFLYKNIRINEKKLILNVFNLILKNINYNKVKNKSSTTMTEYDQYMRDDKISPITHIDFTIWKNSEIQKASVFGGDTDGITTTELYESNEPKRGGLIDLRLGTTGDARECDTCGLNYINCVGHFGHLTLADKIFHMGYLTFVKKILGCICIRCSKLLIHKNEDEIGEILKNKSGKLRLNEIRNLVKNISYCQKANYGCGAPVTKIKLDLKKIILYSEMVIAKEEGNANNEMKKNNKEILTPSVVYDILKGISDQDCIIMGLDPKKTRPEDMIIGVFPIPPVAIRPSVRADFLASSMMEDDLTHKLADIIKANERIAKQNYSENNKFTHDNIYLLQYQIAYYLDSDLDIPKSEQKGKVTKTLGPRLKGKEGRIRDNLMGKRLDYTARTVITSDPTIEINQLGVPVKIAMNLTYPEIVTENNIKFLSKLVKNGRDNYPGANFVFPLSNIDDGKRVYQYDLRFMKDKVELRVGDVVERHLLDDDIVLLNRQPTLHKQSMMGHRVKIINNPTLSTFRLSVAVTTPYNADFDGDEMNIFVPQSLQTQIELEELVDVKRQIITPSTSRTIIGIVQDGLIGSYNLTSPNMRVDWKNAMNIVSYTSIDNFGAFKKNKDYTGHELFSLIIPSKINLRRGNEKDKSFLLIKNGILETGYMTKDLLGSKKKNNITQLIWDEYGIEETKNFLNNTQRLINNFNLYNGFTVGIGDALISVGIKEQIDKLFNTKDLKIKNMVTEFENNPQLMDKELFDRSIFAELNVIREDVSKLIMANVEPDNNFNIMISSGSKGEAVNLGQIGGCIGLQAFEGSLMPKKINSRTLPYFYRDEDTMESRGLIKNSFVSGATFPEFFFHHMTGREGIIDVAIKTAKSGYIQRRLVKILEDCMIKYDGTVRTSLNQITQFIYGDSGADTTKQYEYTMKLIEMSDTDIINKHIFTLDEIKEYNLDDSDLMHNDNIVFEKTSDNTKMKTGIFYNRLITLRDSLRIAQIKTRMNWITMSNIYMMPINFQRIIDNNKNNITLKKSNEKLTPAYIFRKIDEIIKCDTTLLLTMSNADKKNPDSVKYKDDKIAKTALIAALYDSLSPKRTIVEYKLDKNQFDNIVNEIIDNFNKNMAEPGEMVGVIAAQACGEPTTQMSCIYDTIVRINGKTPYYGTIGEFIDDIIDDKKRINNNELISTVCKLTEDYYITSVSTDGVIEWKRISEVSRHPANGGLIKVITKTGKTTTATLSHSFLKLEKDKIVPIKGSELRIGHSIPIARYIPVVADAYMNYQINNGSNGNIKLEYDFGYDCGLYIARKLTKQDIICKYNAVYYDFIEEQFGTRYNEKISNIIYVSNYDFIYGIISGYIQDANRLNANTVMIQSDNKRLINDMSVLINYVGLYAILSEHENIYQMEINNDYDYDNNTDVIWDEIIKLEILPDPNSYVYDFTVPETESFMVDTGILVHNTLNSFHHSGIAVMISTTQGVPRIEELLSLTKNLKTPQMILYPTKEYMSSKNMANKIASYIEYTSLGRLKHKIEVLYDPDPYKKDGFIEKDKAHKIFTTSYGAKKSCQSDINSLPWLLRIELNREKMLEKEVSLLDIKSKLCHLWEKRFDKTNKKEDKKIYDNITQIAILSNTDFDAIPILHIRFDMNKFDISMLNIFIDMFIDNFKLKGIQDIMGISAISDERVLQFDGADNGVEKSKQYVIYTKGCNLYDIRYLNNIDIYKSISNDVVAMYETFGIEAARSTLLREIIYAYERAGPTINYHHVSILIDLMTFTGGLTSIDRHGMNKTYVGPLSRASFEQTIDILTSAAVFGETDNMNGVSSRIMAGLVVKGGTGYCNVILDTDMIQNSEYIDSNTSTKTYNEIVKNTIIKEAEELQANSDSESDDNIFVPS